MGIISWTKAKVKKIEDIVEELESEGKADRLINMYKLERAKYETDLQNEINLAEDAKKAEKAYLKSQKTIKKVEEKMKEMRDKARSTCKTKTL